MTRRYRVAAVAVTLALSTAACSASDGDTTTEETTDATTPAATAEPTTEASESAGAGSGEANTAEVVAAVEALTATLSSEEVDTLSYDFGDEAVTSLWSNLPSCEDGARAGVRHGDLTEEQLAAVLAVAEAALSEDGFTEYQQIIAADDVLGASGGGGGGGGGTMWDSDCYFMAVFGTPSDTEPWTLQFGGHHYARTFTYSGTTVSTTPAFTGVEPTSFDYEGGTAAPLADEVEAIFAMFDGLDDTQLAQAQLDGAYDDVLLGPGEDDQFPTTEGVLVSELPEAQRALVLAAIERWVGDTEGSAAELATLEAELDQTSIAWASSVDPAAQGAYARIDGPSVWIELVNQGGVGTGEVHHHSIYRDKDGDYGDAA